MCAQPALQLCRVKLGGLGVQPLSHSTLRENYFFDRTRHENDFIIVLERHPREQHRDTLDGTSIETLLIKKLGLLSDLFGRFPLVITFGVVHVRDALAIGQWLYA